MSKINYFSSSIIVVIIVIIKVWKIQEIGGKKTPTFVLSV